MIAAAQAAAEAALREAMAGENNNNNSKGPSCSRQQPQQQQQQQAPSSFFFVQQQLQQEEQLHQTTMDEFKSPEPQMYSQSEQQNQQLQQEEEALHKMLLQQSQPQHLQQQQLLLLQQQLQQQQQAHVGSNLANQDGGDPVMMDLLYQQQQQVHPSGGMILDPSSHTTHHNNNNANHGMLIDQPSALQPSSSPRPREHYLTITNDGTIVEASNSVLGYPPEAMLMTSTYDNLFDEDLPGLLCVKSQFWDKQELQGVEVYLRRRSIEGEWIWLCCKALQWVEMNTQPQQYHQAVIPGGNVLVLEERIVDDIATAQWLNRRIRIAAVIVQAAEAARLTHDDDGGGGGGGGNHGHHPNSTTTNSGGEGAEHAAAAVATTGEDQLERDDSRTLLNETFEMEVLLRRLQETHGVGGEFSHDNLHQLLEIATTQGKGGGSGAGNQEGRVESGGGGKEESNKSNSDNKNRKNYDPSAMMESVRKGIRLDLGLLTTLEPEEVLLLTMVLTGELLADHVAPLILQSLQAQSSGGNNNDQNNWSSLSDLLLWHRQQQRHEQQQQQFAAAAMQAQQHQNHRLTSRFGGGPSAIMPSKSSSTSSRRGLPKTNTGAWIPPVPPLSPSPPVNPPPPIFVVNLSYTYIGNVGVEILGEALFAQGTALKAVDISFCGIDEKGFLALARALAKRKKKTTMAPIKGLILSGNCISQAAASALGTALAVSTVVKRQGSGRRQQSKRRNRSSGGYDSDSSDEEDDDDFDDFTGSSGPAAKSASDRERRGDNKHKRYDSSSSYSRQQDEEGQVCCDQHSGIQVLHLASTSLKAGALGRLLEGLGPHSSMRELNLSSNHFGPAGAGVLSRCLEGGSSNSSSSRSSGASPGTHVPFPYLDRIDISNNSLGDEGATQLTKIISNRSKVDLVDLRLSSNSITSTCIDMIMNKLLHHNIVSLALDQNAIGDQGCQLVAASLQSMKSLARLNLSFNQIGSRGINSLMRSLIACESVTFLGLSGNILKISGAMALAFTLAQHPRLEELHLDNCCLGQAAQCHITTGIISNRWVPMKRLAGYAVGPPMVAIGALQPFAQNLSNEECFRIRKDEQMKTILQWMANHRGSKVAGTMDPSVMLALGSDSSDQRFLTPEFVSNINDVHGIPSQNAYFRMLGWLSSIPFDDDELTVLQKYFYDVDGGDGDRGSDGYVNLKLRGDLLAALDSEIAGEIRDVMPPLGESLQVSVGIDLDKVQPHRTVPVVQWTGELSGIPVDNSWSNVDNNTNSTAVSAIESSREQQFPSIQDRMQMQSEPETEGMQDASPHMEPRQPGPKEKKFTRAKPRISLFPKFEQQLEQLKSAAAEMIEQEEDPTHHEVILTQYAEASLTILRQLRYHCMNSGLDGWRQGGLKRKVLVVDDSRIIRRMVSRAFEDANFIVDTAANGAEGVEKMKASIYDIAFMDIDMPVMNGFEATKKLREWEDKSRPGARQPICALTAAYVDDFERSELMKFKEAGLDVMESKPCNIPRLLKVVDDVSPMFSNLRLDATKQERTNGTTVD